MMTKDKNQDTTPTLEAYPQIIDTTTNIQLGNDPEKATTEAIATAKYLKKLLIDQKKGLVKNGKRYIEFTEWQTLGNYYQVTVDTEIIEVIGNGRDLVVKARGTATYIPTGQRVGSAESFCERREPGKGKHSMNQIASMAQTRAGSKAMKNALGWVVELAGISSTPAEEMEGINPTPPTPQRTQRPAPTKTMRKAPKSSINNDEVVSEMPVAEKVQDTPEPENVQEGEVNTTDWDALKFENETYAKVIDSFTEGETITARSIRDKARDMVGEQLLTPDEKKEVFQFLRGK